MSRSLCLAHHRGGRGLQARPCPLALAVRVPTQAPEPPVTRGHECIPPILPSGLLPLCLPPSRIRPLADPGAARATGTHRLPTAATPPLCQHLLLEQPRSPRVPLAQLRKQSKTLSRCRGRPWTGLDAWAPWMLDSGTRCPCPLSQPWSLPLGAPPLQGRGLDHAHSSVLSASAIEASVPKPPSPQAGRVGGL